MIRLVFIQQDVEDLVELLLGLFSFRMDLFVGFHLVVIILNI